MVLVIRRLVIRLLWWIGYRLNDVGTRRLGEGRRRARRWWNAGDTFIDAGTHLLGSGPLRREVRVR